MALHCRCAQLATKLIPPITLLLCAVAIASAFETTLQREGFLHSFVSRSTHCSLFREPVRRDVLRLKYAEATLISKGKAIRTRTTRAGFGGKKDTSLKMTGQNIDGKAIAATIRAEMKERVTKLKEETGKVPGLAVILVGRRTDSATYVRMKKKACEECGIASFGYEFPDTVTQDELQKLLGELNDRKDVHGILVQLPLPKHIDENAVLNTVDKSKDVDGLHSLNVASLCSTSTHAGTTKLNWKDFTEIPFHIPCTPQGCIELLDRSGVEIQGKNCVVIGRSNLVGLPVAMLLMHRNATVTIVHSKTTDAPEVVARADIIVAAVGRTEMVKGDWLKLGCVVIDVGINSKDDPTAKRGYRLVGDVDFNEAREKASLITPVPGGVGPMTIAMLLRNTLNQCCRS